MAQFHDVIELVLRDTRSVVKNCNVEVLLFFSGIDDDLNGVRTLIDTVVNEIGNRLSEIVILPLVDLHHSCRFGIPINRRIAHARRQLPRLYESNELPITMADQSLLWDEFYRNCKSHDLPDDLIKEVYDYLMRNQYLSQGVRRGKQVELKRILEKALEGN